LDSFVGDFSREQAVSHAVVHSLSFDQQDFAVCLSGGNGNGGY